MTKHVISGCNNTCPFLCQCGSKYNNPPDGELWCAHPLTQGNELDGRECAGITPDWCELKKEPLMVSLTDEVFRYRDATAHKGTLTQGDNDQTDQD